MNIVLIGYRGTGKSAVGALLAERLAMPCLCMDDRIVEKSGLSIAALVERDGWQAFRDLESEVVREFASVDNCVIDTGGGVIERPGNMEALRPNSRIFWLRASVETVVARIAAGTERPALTAGKSFTDEVEEVLERRSPMYARDAHHAVDTDGIAPQAVADRIVELLEERLDAPLPP